MDGIPVLALAGWSGAGKTTVMEKLIAYLCAHGLRVAALKHDVHGLAEDDTNKDTGRFKRAGAFPVIAAGAEDNDLEALLVEITSVDIILVEGFKRAPLTQIGISRKANTKGFTDEFSRYIALVTDEKVNIKNIPVFSLEETEALGAFVMQNMEDFTHFNNDGRAKMVDVGEKPQTVRTATAAARVLVSRETFGLIRTGGMKKGDVLTVAQIAGIMGAKRTPDLIPMCHPLILDGIDLHLSTDEEACSVEIIATVSCAGRTGVEMEALTAASVAALTVYDMCKAVQKDMVITDIRLLDKTGGIHGDYHREETT